MIKRHVKGRQCCDPYDVFSLVYDRFMSHVDYREWAGYIADLLGTYAGSTGCVLDCACGTGSMAAALAGEGFDVAGFDSSLAMVRQAAGKNLKKVWQGDMRSVPLKREWDAALCLYDSLQYLCGEDAGLFFSNIAGVLRRGGMFIADLVPEVHLISYWSDFVEHEEIGQWQVTRKSRLDRRARMQRTDFEFRHKKQGTVLSEHHVQYVYSIAQITNMLRNAGFSVIDIFDRCTRNRGTERSDRVHVVCRLEATL